MNPHGALTVSTWWRKLLYDSGREWVISRK